MQLHRLCVTNLTLSSRGGDSSVGRTGPTEKPGAMLTWVRVPVRQGIFLPESAPSADSLSYLSVQAHVCNCMHQHLYARFKYHTLAAIPLFGHTKTDTAHTDRNGWRCSLAAAVPYPGKVTRHFRKGQTAGSTKYTIQIIIIYIYIYMFCRNQSSRPGRP